MEILKNRKKNIHLVCDQVSGWSNKVQYKLNESIGEQIPKQNQTMSEVFQNITDLVTGQLNEIIIENEKRNTQNRLDGIEEEDNIADEFN